MESSDCRVAAPFGDVCSPAAWLVVAATSGAVEDPADDAAPPVASRRPPWRRRRRRCRTAERSSAAMPCTARAARRRRERRLAERSAVAEGFVAAALPAGRLGAAPLRCPPARRPPRPSPRATQLGGALVVVPTGGAARSRRAGAKSAFVHAHDRLVVLLSRASAAPPRRGTRPPPRAADAADARPRRCLFGRGRAQRFELGARGLGRRVRRRELVAELARLVAHDEGGEVVDLVERARSSSTSSLASPTRSIAACLGRSSRSIVSKRRIGFTRVEMPEPMVLRGAAPSSRDPLWSVSHLQKQVQPRAKPTRSEMRRTGRRAAACGPRCSPACCSPAASPRRPRRRGGGRTTRAPARRRRRRRARPRPSAARGRDAAVLDFVDGVRTLGAARARCAPRRTTPRSSRRRSRATRRAPARRVARAHARVPDEPQRGVRAAAVGRVRQVRDLQHDRVRESTLPRWRRAPAPQRRRALCVPRAVLRGDAPRGAHQHGRARRRAQLGAPRRRRFELRAALSHGRRPGLPQQLLRRVRRVPYFEPFEPPRARPRRRRGSTRARCAGDRGGAAAAAGVARAAPGPACLPSRCRAARAPPPLPDHPSGRRRPSRRPRRRYAADGGGGGGGLLSHASDLHMDLACGGRAAARRPTTRPRRSAAARGAAGRPSLSAAARGAEGRAAAPRRRPTAGSAPRRTRRRRGARARATARPRGRSTGAAAGCRRAASRDWPLLFAFDDASAGAPPAWVDDPRSCATRCSPAAAAAAAARAAGAAGAAAAGAAPPPSAPWLIEGSATRGGAAASR